MTTHAAEGRPILVAGAGELTAGVLTEGSTDDSAQVPAWLGAASVDLASAMAGGACDGTPAYEAAARRRHEPLPDTVVPPRASAATADEKASANAPRDRRIRHTAGRGRLAWRRGGDDRRCAELAHANRVALAGQLSAAIAHEVGQPIAGIVTNAQVALRLLGAEPADVEEVRRALQRVVRDGRRAGDILGRIRALVRNSPPRAELLSVNDVVREALGLAQGQIAGHDVSVRAELAEGLPPARGDPVQLQQVVLNLVVNVVEAMGAEAGRARRLVVGTARLAPGGVLVAVRDSGPGLGQGDPERVFDAFYTTKPEGLGMGLAICRSIVRAHGGRLWAARGSPRGAVFRFTLPWAPDEAPAADGPRPADPSAGDPQRDHRTRP